MLVTLNNNDVLLNLYGDRDNYKPFPSIGEEVKDGILCARRRINYNSILVDFKDNSSVINSDDTCFFINGVVENIEIFSNYKEADFKYPFNAPILKIFEHQKQVFTEILQIVNGLKKKNIVLRDNLGYMYQKTQDHLSDKPFSLDRSEYEGAVIRFTIKERVPIGVGSKITGR